MSRAGAPSCARAIAQACCALLLLCVATVHAHERDYYFERIDSSQGLAQNSVSVIFQDPRGFLWLGTQGGLHRYDGYRLKHYRHDPARADSLPDNLVTALASAGDGRLWVGTRSGGLSLFDTDADRVLPLPAWSASLGRIGALATNAGGTLWIGTQRGMFASDPPYTSLRTLWTAAADARGISSFTTCADGGRYALAGDTVLAVGNDRAGTRVLASGLGGATSLLCRTDGSLVLGDTSGVQVIDRHGGGVASMWPSAGDMALTSSNVRALAEDRAGRLWLAVADIGLVKLDAHAHTMRVLRPHPDVPGSLPEAQISSLYVDKSGLLWVGGVTRGAAYADPAGTPFQYVFDDLRDDDPVGGNNVRALYEEPGNGLWVGLGGNGLRHYDPVQRHFEDYGDLFAAALPGRAPHDVRVYAIVPDGNDSYRLASNYGVLAFHPRQRTVQVLYRPDPEKSRLPLVRSLLHARDGSWWLGLYAGGVVRRQAGQPPQWFQHVPGRADSLASDMVVTLAEDPDGAIWVGTADGLSRIDPASGHVRSFHEVAGHADSLSGRVVTDLYFDDQGTLWVGTQTGLNRLQDVDAGGAHFHRYLASSGLPDATVYCIMEDAARKLWISTNLGVARLDPASGAVRAFTPRDGLQGMEYNSGACTRKADGSILFGGVNGFDRVQPATVVPGHFLPPTAITEVSIGVRSNAAPPPPAGHALDMPKAARVVRFDFAAMDFAAPAQNRFQYRLRGFDRDWVDAGTRHSATYTNLDAGDYRFEVRGSNHEGGFGAPAATLSLHVIPPWWQSRPMRAAYAALAALLLLAGFAVARARRGEERRHQQQLRDREDRLSMALWGSGDEFWDLDLREGRLYRLGADQMLGTDAEHEISLDAWRDHIVHPEDLPQVQRALSAHAGGDADHFEQEFRVRSARDQWIWVLSRGKVVERDADGHAVRMSGTARDIGQRRTAERDRRIAAEVIRSMTEAVTVTDLDFRFCSVNPAFTRMTGYGEAEIVGRDAALLNCRQHTPEMYDKLREEVVAHGHWRGEMWQRRKNGGEFLCWVEIGGVSDPDGERTHYVAVLSDITDRKRAEQELRYLAKYDMLTGLPNRTLLSERLGDAIMRSRRNGRVLAVLYVDLDRFKQVNDSMGHATGDRLLKGVGARLRHCLREQDTVARVGGDEFTLVLEDIVGIETAEATAQRVIEAFNAPLLLDTRQEVMISTSVGIALYPEHGQSPNDLLKYADTAMYQAKQRGRNTWALYTEAMEVFARQRANMTGALRRAIERGELDVVYQPKLTLGDDRIVGVEALARWHSKDLGEVPPAVFVPLAEETGLIVEIGEFVLRRACADLAGWRREGFRDLNMAVNLSMAQLQRSELASSLQAIIGEHAIPAQRIELELTESMLMGNVEHSMRTLGELKAIGVSLAIDDFGTGYSSLAYLKRLPIDTLKIDRAFINDVDSDTENAAITNTIISMAHSLGLHVVAEGVETAGELDYLRMRGCDAMQGNWLSVPLPTDACLRFCAARRDAAVS
ncbi:MAG TPA: EAL domain-containing protein [Rhodanobacteraceae bacterium]|nr:EAL domain-containing protein [Rhodanobacteraceae bacterium]